eukprot:m.321293 g.321293  ORF g.321293 m.321293 type:complete len:61 (+) comp19708_c13_seq4:252-434(+)
MYSREAGMVTTLLFWSLASTLTHSHIILECSWCSVIFIIVALATSHWAVVEITFPSGNQP